MITVGAEGFRIVRKQNALFHGKVDYEKSLLQQANVRKLFGAINLPAMGLPDEVFVANAALTLPMLPTPTFLTANFKYAQRKEEADHIASFLRKIGKVVKWPYDSVLEGQGETKWFRVNGRLIVVVGYGFRSTKTSVADLDEILNKIYTSQGVDPPLVVGVRLINPKFYHMDIATHAIRLNKCLIQAGSMRYADVQKLEGIGIECIVRAFDDPFAINAVLRNGKFYTHVLTPKAKSLLTPILNSLGDQLVEVDVSEFEKAGGGLRCMTLSIY